LLPSWVYSTASALPEGPQSGEVIGMVGSGKEVNGVVLVRSFASRPFWEERRVPRQASMNGGRPISMFDRCALSNIWRYIWKDFSGAW
jgi:hypothetical protein